MKQVLFFVCISFCFIRCKHEKSKSEHEDIHKFIDTINIVNTDSYIEYRSALLKRNLSYLEIYLIDSIKAISDIKNNHLVYPYENYDYLISFNQFKKTLKEKYDINTIEVFRSCMVNDSSEYTETYIKIMTTEINNRFGENFIQKSIIESDSIFYQKNKDLIYDFQNSYAALKYYQSKKYSKYQDSIRTKIENSLIYPKNYNYKNELTYTYTSADFILIKDGSIDNLYVRSHFANKKNEKFRNLFEKQVKNHFVNIKLNPVEVYGLKINTEEHFAIYHK